MSPFVDFEVFGSREDFAAARKRAGEGFFSCVDANVIHQFVFGFEGPTTPRTALPKTRVTRALRTADVVDRQMGDDFAHRGKGFAAVFAALEPQTGEIGGLTHVPKKGALVRGINLLVVLPGVDHRVVRVVHLLMAILFPLQQAVPLMAVALGLIVFLGRHHLRAFEPHHVMMPSIDESVQHDCTPSRHVTARSPSHRTKIVYNLSQNLKILHP